MGLAARASIFGNVNLQIILLSTRYISSRGRIVSKYLGIQGGSRVKQSHDFALQSVSNTLFFSVLDTVIGMISSKP